MVVEQAVLKVLDRVVHQLDSLEVAIHHDIQEAMQQRHRTELEQLWVVLPALQNPVHIEVMVGAQGHDAAGHDER